MESGKYDVEAAVDLWKVSSKFDRFDQGDENRTEPPRSPADALGLPVQSGPRQPTIRNEY